MPTACAKSSTLNSSFLQSFAWRHDDVGDQQSRNQCHDGDEQHIERGGDAGDDVFLDEFGEAAKTEAAGNEQ